MASDVQDLTALLGSRICHDLISPLGAIGNGLELLQMSGSAAGPEMALIAESVAHANARIRFFRVAFGGSGTGQRVGRDEAVALLAGLTGGQTRLAIDWALAGEAPRPQVKLAFLALQCLDSAMPRGGRIGVSCHDGSWLLQATGERMKADPALWSRLAGGDAVPEVTAAEVHFALLPAEARRQGRRLRLDLGPERILLGF